MFQSHVHVCGGPGLAESKAVHRYRSLLWFYRVQVLLKLLDSGSQTEPQVSGVSGI